MRWAGPEYWGNRLQDWSVRDGLLVCNVGAPNRTLHCLTHRATGPTFETSVTVDPTSLQGTAQSGSCIGLRLGVKGRFDDYRSAAVFHKSTEQIRIECWPRHVDPSSPGARQYEGWPITVPRDSGDGRTPVGFLQTVRVTGIDDPVVEVRTDAGELVYARRIVGRTFTPPVFASGTHLVCVGDTAQARWLEKSVTEAEWGDGTLDFDFTS